MRTRSLGKLHSNVQVKSGNDSRDCGLDGVLTGRGDGRCGWKRNRFRRIGNIWTGNDIFGEARSGICRLQTPARSNTAGGVWAPGPTLETP